MKRKLITLHSSTNDGLFDCNFNDDIIIDKNSHVSFVSCSLSLDNNKIIIDNDNDGIIFRIGTAPIRTTRIPHGIYSNDNIGDLIMRIQNAMNSELNIDEPDEHGQEILIDLSIANKIQIAFDGNGYNHAVENGAFEVQSFHANNVVASSAGGLNTEVLTKTIGISGNRTGQFHSYVTANGSNNRGCGGSQVEIGILSNADANTNAGFILGWANGNSPSTLSRDGLTYFVEVQNSNTAPYKIKEQNGVIRDTTLVPRVGDIVSLNLSLGNIYMTVYNVADGVGVEPYEEELGPFPYDTSGDQVNDPFYTVLGIFGAGANTVLKNYKVNFTPHAPQITGKQLDLVEVGGVGSQPPASNGNDPHDYAITFPNLSLANNLGYNELTYQVINQDPPAIFIADTIFQNVFHPDNYKIELLNINLESYDSQTQGRRNILGIIPISETFLNQNISLLQYEVNNIIALSVRNKNTEALRNIRARLINSHNETAVTYGLSFINIMVEYGC
jgi:hypothetical protein